MYCLVIGAGWYGCHIALTLQKEGHTVIQVDKANNFFTGSSSKNQNRLHLGFHYPRTEDTIKECQEGYPIFIERYGDLTDNITHNIYFIANEGSLVSMKEYLSILDVHKCDYEYIDISSLPVEIEAVEYPIINVKERYINPKKASQYFKDNLTLTELSENYFNSIQSIQTSLNQSFDLIINCTYNHLSPIDYEDYELFLTLLYHIDTPIIFAYTIMDGPFFSIYPYDIEKKIFTVTHVKHCVLVKSRNISTSIDICSELILEKRHIVDEEITHFIPSWKSIASPIGYYTSWKTKHNNFTCDRSVKSEIDGNIIHIYGGKITGIFQAEKIVRSFISEISNKRIE